ncbi:Hydrogenase maturation factor HoxV/HupK [Caenispirillum salinarum AK4]|uniref:Hydrogenase maturation factor HoxV/HupK n=1 Tax=Caenispirillum salinarum AK4 TaxID=1238182 RepID=K9H135_9PROT|nr:nickel-dependent hydrogenase large subunit [Caenispirillum salinarum]EKV30749.1 Hydrogenase maturation factor HoxV/HupK [Caenispirillum salinarum AK4]
MIPGGDRIDIVLALDPSGAVAAAEVASSRAVTASRVLEGKAPEEALRLVPLLFALCGSAQQMAGLRAVEAALSITVPPREAAARHMAVLAETVAEHATRMLVDWPKLAGAAPDMAHARVVRTAAAAVQAALYPAGGRERIGGGAAPDAGALARAAEGLDAAVTAALPLAEATAARVPGLAAPAVAPFPADLDPAWLAARMDDAAFLKAPEGPDGTVFETGPAVRVSGAADVAGRFAARLSEARALAREIVELAHEAAYSDAFGDGVSAGLGSGRGLGAVEAARGRLVHLVDIADGRIARYRILAPTEWNFHPRGALGVALDGLRGRSAAEAEQAAGWIVAALDPCVACCVSTREAHHA